MGVTKGRAYGGKLPDDRRLDRRNRLVAAGLELFGTKGYAVTTIAELCREAAVAPVKFYEEFQSKEAVLLAVAEEIGQSVTEDVLAALRETPAHPGGDLIGTARAGLSAFCHSLLDDPRRARVFVSEVVGVSPAVDARRREVLDGFATLTLRTMWAFLPDAPRRRKPTPREQIVGNTLVGGVNEAISAWLQSERPPRVDELVETLAQLHAVVGTWLVAPQPPARRPPSR